MKKHLIFAFIISAFIFTACDNDDDFVYPITAKVVNSKPMERLLISSFSPESAEGGATIAIYGENFGKTVDDNFVTFSGWEVEVTHIPYEGLILVQVPLHLQPGDYQIYVSANGQTGNSDKIFKLITSKSF
jgi:hypothetical protein